MLQKWERDVSDTSPVDISGMYQQVAVFVWWALKGIVVDSEGPGMENKLHFGF